MKDDLDEIQTRMLLIGWKAGKANLSLTNWIEILKTEFVLSEKAIIDFKQKLKNKDKNEAK